MATLPPPKPQTAARPRGRVLTQEQLDAFHRDGYLIVPGVFSAGEMDEALAAVDRITYGKSFAEWSAEYAASGGKMAPVADGISKKAAHGRAQFPSGVWALDRLLENETYLDIFCQLLGTDEPTYLNGHLFVRAGPNDTRHPEHPWEGYHIDHDTNSFLPPWIGCGHFDYMGSGIVLHDIDAGCAPMAIIPGSHHVIARHLPELVREGSFVLPGGIPDIRKIKQFAPAIPMMATRGSAAFSSSYLVHAAVPFKDKRQQRSLWTLSLGRDAAQAFTRFAVPYHYGERDAFIPYWTKTTPRVRSLFGWPPPGHPYYTPQTVDMLELRFPGMDLSPYRSWQA